VLRFKLVNGSLHVTSPDVSEDANRLELATIWVMGFLEPVHIFRLPREVLVTDERNIYPSELDKMRFVLLCQNHGDLSSLVATTALSIDADFGLIDAIRPSVLKSPLEPSVAVEVALRNSYFGRHSIVDNEEHTSPVNS
jgi:hypothetical protein